MPSFLGGITYIIYILYAGNSLLITISMIVGVRVVDSSCMPPAKTRYNYPDVICIAKCSICVVDTLNSHHLDLPPTQDASKIQV